MREFNGKPPQGAAPEHLLRSTELEFRSETRELLEAPVVAETKTAAEESAFARHAPVIQFAAYETGNIVAAVAGNGGLSATQKQLSRIFENPDLGTMEKLGTIAEQYPDAATAILIGGVVMASGPVRHMVKKLENTAILNTADIIISSTAMGTLAYTLSMDSALVTKAAAAFVVGSSLIMHAKKNPLFLKMGGVMYTAGGALLGAWGAQMGMHSLQDVLSDPTLADQIKLAIDASTALTGAFVAKAGLLTAQGGQYATLDYKEPKDHTFDDSLANMFLHPKKGALARVFDKTIDPAVRRLNDMTRPMLGFVPRDILKDKPLLTSAYIRVPMRAITGGLATLGGAMGMSGMFEFAAANALWSVGDTATGTMDAPAPKADEPDIRGLS